MSDVTAVDQAAGKKAVSSRAAPARRWRQGPPGGQRRPIRLRLAPLPWLLPAIALIAVVVLWPIVTLVQTSVQHINSLGLVEGSNGAKNFSDLFANPNLPGILVRSVIWVVAIVAITMLLSLALAALFNQRFPGRRVARWALIAPWAASVMMTALIFKWMLQPDSGVINVFLHQLGLVNFNSGESGWLGRPDAAMVWMIGVAVFVSLPFTTYTLLAGLQTIPGELLEAGRVDGASRWQSYRLITLPLLRPAFLVAMLINVINVFNSFPIIWEMTRGGPGYATNTTTVFMYNLKTSFVAQAAAMSIVNFGLIVVVILFFLWVNNRNRSLTAGAR